MSTSELLLFSESLDNGVATITFNNIAKQNALTLPMVIALLKRLQYCEKNPRIRVVVLTGAGKYFCTGMDLSNPFSGKESGPSSAAASGSESGPPAKPKFAPSMLFDKLQSFSKPLVCVMNGPALGGGVGIVFCCDFRVACKGCFIAFPEVTRGFYPALISAVISPDLGPFHTRSLMMTGEKCTVERLLQLNSFTAVVDEPQQLEVAVGNIVRGLLRGPSSAHAGVKRCIRAVSFAHCAGGAGGVVDTVLVPEFGKMMASQEARYGLKRFKGSKTLDPAQLWKEYYDGLAENGQQVSKL